MSTERLLLEVESRRAGLEVTKPPVLTGASGVEHSFSFLGRGASNLAVDIYESITEIEVIRTFVKGFDAGVPVHVVLSGEQCTEGARRLAAEYGMRIMREEDISSFFENLVLKTPNH